MIRASKRAFAVFFLCWGCGLCPPSAARADFIPGNVYLLDNIAEGCNSFEQTRIIEVDPRAGTSRVFATIPFGSCGVHYGLAFTPDGSRLRVGEFLNNRVLEIDGDGNTTVAMTGADGIRRPIGANSMGYDAAGNFYAMNYSPLSIRKFPADGGPFTVVADRDDGMRDLQSIAVAPGGDVFYLNRALAGNPAQLLRFSPTGERTVVDEGFSTFEYGSLTIDQDGNVYAWLLDGIYRYPGGLAGAGELIANWPLGGATPVMSFSPVDGMLYLLNQSADQFRSLDPATGVFSPVTPIFEAHVLGYGMATYVPEPASLTGTAVAFLALILRVRRTRSIPSSRN